ncbi:MAG: MFS transporter [Limnochordales bacterium]|nr:MFS transporter [Limnochordales bacterium]
MLTRPVIAKYLPGKAGWPLRPLSLSGLFSYRLRTDDPVLEANHRYNVLNGMAAMVALNLSGPFYPIFAERLGASNLQIALLTSLPAAMMAVCVLPGALWVERAKDKKRLATRLLLLTRLLIVAMALVPFFPAVIRPGLVVAFVALGALPGAVVTVAWQTLMGELFPPAVRADAFAIRSRWMSWTGMAAVVGAGLAIDALPKPLGYQLTFAVAGLFGVLETYYLSRLITAPSEPAGREDRVGECSHARPVGRGNSGGSGGSGGNGSGIAVARGWVVAVRRGLVAEWERLRARPQYLHYVGIVFFYHFAWMALWPVFTVYKLDVLNVDNTWMSLYTVAGSLGSIVTYRLWSRLCNRRGNGWVVGWTALGLALTPVTWVWLSRTLSLQQFLYVSVSLDLIGGAVVGGFNLALFNQWLEYSDPARRPSDIAYLNTVVQMAAIVSPLVGMALYESFGFAVSMLSMAVLRAVGSLLFLRISGDARAGTNNGTVLPAGSERPGRSVQAG